VEFLDAIRILIPSPFFLISRLNFQFLNLSVISSSKFHLLYIYRGPQPELLLVRNKCHCTDVSVLCCTGTYFLCSELFLRSKIDYDVICTWNICHIGSIRTKMECFLTSFSNEFHYCRYRTFEDETHGQTCLHGFPII
jgi:hypothetical protein